MALRLQPSLFYVHDSTHRQHFKDTLDAAKQAHDLDQRYRFPYGNYHDERTLHGETVHGRWNTQGVRGLSTNVDLTRHILIPFRRGMLRADVAREIVKAVMANSNIYFANSRQFDRDATGKTVLAYLTEQKKRRNKHPGPIELIFGHYADPTKVNRESPNVHLVLTLADAHADKKASKDESCVHVRLSTPVSVRHLGTQSGGDIRSRHAFSIQDYPAGALSQIADARQRLNRVVDSIAKNLPKWRQNPFDSKHHLARDLHHYYNLEESMT
jgi:hypothetical protein